MPFHVPVAIVPNVVKFVEPVQVDNVVFSTLFKLKSVFVSATVRLFNSLPPPIVTNSPALTPNPVQKVLPT